MRKRILSHLPQNGFTLIELLAFIVISGILMSVMLLGVNTSLRSMPAINKQWMAIQAARRCMEWFVGQRQINGYSALTCPSTPSTTSCSPPSGYTVVANVTCTTWNSDTEYQTLTITVSGAGNASVSTQFGDY